LADELAKWRTVLHAAPVEFHAAGDALTAELAATTPAPVATALVHGDFRLGNVLFAGSTPAALVDWEIWSVGDPRVDLGYFAVFADHRNFPGLGTEVEGLPGEAELVDAYAAARGVEVA